MKEIKGYPGYFITEFGDVYSIKKGRLKSLRIQTITSGYKSVRLVKQGNTEGTTKRIHRLVAEHFIDNPNGYQEVDHIDRDKSNNSVGNLRWVSRSENCKNVDYSSRKRTSNNQRFC